jgi:hypothetical protein
MSTKFLKGKNKNWLFYTRCEHTYRVIYSKLHTYLHIINNTERLNFLNSLGHFHYSETRPSDEPFHKKHVTKLFSAS